MSTDADTVRDARAAHALGLRGDFRDADALVERLRDDPSPIARAWTAALSASRWHSDPLLGAMPTRAEIAAITATDAEVRCALSIACSHAARGAWLGFEATALQSWLERSELVVDRDDPSATLRLDLDRAWSALCRGLAADGVEDLAKRAADEADPVFVIEAAALRGWAAAIAGDADEALSAARRASRMARTEALPQSEYLANLVLARVRRLTGRPHLSARILGGLMRVAPTPWHGCLTWELLMSGAMAMARAVDLSAGFAAEFPSAAIAASGLRDALAAAVAGSRDSFDSAAETAIASVGEFIPQAADLTAVLVAGDVKRDPADAPTIATWCEGSEAQVPAFLRGLAGDLEADSADDATTAFACITNAGTSRRVLGLGVRLVTGAEMMHAMRGRPGRVETVISALGLAGGTGLSLTDLFRVVYGFEYVSANHETLFRVLIHRVRGHLGELAELNRHDDALRLAVNVPIIVPDPRCTQALEDLMLRLFARQGGGTAKGAATELNVPLRTAQLALKQLVDEGAVLMAREGRKVTYSVEDTTFSEPTVH